MPPALHACPRCGLVQHWPESQRRQRVACARCKERLRPRNQRADSAPRTAALALAGLILYPLAIALPILRLEQLGRVNESSVIEGVTSLFAHGYWFVGGIVFLCSVVLPVGKLVALLVLNLSPSWLGAHHKATTYRIVEFTGRWGMLDVLLVAILVAALKLRDLVELTPGPAAIAFTTVVILSLLASASFDPHVIWDEDAS
ncbi:MAG: paraquat-inducible protein A [Planctomycetota bacterium]